MTNGDDKPELPSWMTCNLPLAQGIKAEIDNLCNFVYDSRGAQKLDYLRQLVAARNKLRSLKFRWSNYLTVGDLSQLTKFMRAEARKIEKEIGIKFGVAQQPSGLSNILFVDTETTGIERHDEPISLAAVLVEFDSFSGKLVKEIASYHGYREPSCLISQDAYKIHGISLESINGKEFDLWSIICIFQSANLCIAHNASFDSRMIGKILPADSYRAEWACSCWDVQWPEFGSRKLDTICWALGIDRPEPHDAMSDTRAMMASLLKPMNEQENYLMNLISRSRAARILNSY